MNEIYRNQSVNGLQGLGSIAPPIATAPALVGATTYLIEQMNALHDDLNCLEQFSQRLLDPRPAPNDAPEKLPMESSQTVEGQLRRLKELVTTARKRLNNVNRNLQEAA